MKTSIFIGFAVLGGLSGFVLGVGTARATLGEPASSITADASQMNAVAGTNTARPIPGLPREGAAPSGYYSIQQITTPGGTVVSEYVGQNGRVFAVTWRGPKPPDVGSLLGAYYKQYSDAAEAGSPSPFGPHVSAVHASDVTVETGGHMGLMWGRAYLPAKLPAGVSVSEIK